MDEIQSSGVEYRDIPGYVGVYQVSNLGDVIRTGRNHGATFGKSLKPALGRGGYPVVTLTLRSRSVKAYVHALVAAAFLGPRPDGKEVNHKDRNKLNPRHDNLEYVTRSENVRHAINLGIKKICGEQKKFAKLTEADVRLIRSSCESSRLIAKRFGVHHSTVNAIRRGRKWSHVV